MSFRNKFHTRNMLILSFIDNVWDFYWKSFRIVYFDILTFWFLFVS